MLFLIKVSAVFSKVLQICAILKGNEKWKKQLHSR